MIAAQPPERPAVPAAAVSLVLLWVAWALLLLLAMLLGNTTLTSDLGLDLSGGHRSLPATAARMGSSLVLVLTAWLAFGFWRRLPARRFILCVAIGMTLGTVGDFFNAGQLDFVPLPNPVLGGILAFGLGHVAYIAGCLSLARQLGLTSRRAMTRAIVVWQLIGLVGWYLVVQQGTEARALVWPALTYSLLLAGTAGVTSGLAVQDQRFTALAVGAALFLASDLILACELFRGQFAYDTECVWLTYGPGQMLIVFSTITAAAATTLLLTRRA